jgi:hypothetical protein
MSPELFDNTWNKFMVMYFKHGLTYLEASKRTLESMKKLIGESHEDCDNCALHQSDDPKEIDEDFEAQEYMEQNL